MKYWIGGFLLLALMHTFLGILEYESWSGRAFYPVVIAFWYGMAIWTVYSEQKLQALKALCDAEHREFLKVLAEWEESQA